MRHGTFLRITVLAVLLCLCGTWLAAPAAAEEPASFLRLPVVEESAETSSGLKTVWSCVWFGAYPSAEVVDSSWNAVDAYALQDGDVLRDDGLFARLAAADWQEDRTELDGVSYLRVGLDSAPMAGLREQHYHWEYDRPWHYFVISPLRWRVLDLQDGKALLLADRMPDSVPFHEDIEGSAWDGSTLRSWLNGYGPEANRTGADYTGTGFIDRAFTPAQREAILPAACENLPNRDYGTDSGRNTEDRLFLLSNAEVFEGENAGRYGFHPGRDYDDPAKRFTSTLYAKCMGAWWSPVEDYAGNSFWFMRTSGYTPQSVTYVCDFGYIYSKGTLVTCSDAGVLPAMWVDLNRAELTGAGERSSLEILHPAVLPEVSEVPEISGPAVVADAAQPGGAYTVWNAVTFGTYPRTEITEEADAALYGFLASVPEDRAERDGMRYVRTDGRWFRCDPITWRVLEVADGTALLMSDRGLDCLPYHNEYADVFWESSDLRAWLNGPFLDAAFTDAERAAIIRSDVANDSNHYFGTACGSGTHDRAFILSEAEVFSSARAEAYGFRPSDAVADAGRRILPTAYAAARGAWQAEQADTAGIGFWLLRTNGYTQDNIVYVGEKGYLYNRGIPVTCPDALIVPAIRVQLGAAALEKAPDISSRLE